MVDNKSESNNSASIDSNSKDSDSKTMSLKDILYKIERNRTPAIDIYNIIMEYQPPESIGIYKLISKIEAIYSLLFFAAFILLIFFLALRYPIFIICGFSCIATSLILIAIKFILNAYALNTTNNTRKVLLLALQTRQMI